MLVFYRVAGCTPLLGAVESRRQRGSEAEFACIDCRFFCCVAFFCVVVLVARAVLLLFVAQLVATLCVFGELDVFYI